MPLGEIIQRTTEEGEEYSVFTCSTCETEHDYQYEAEECCVFWCENCGTWYENEENMQACCSFECDHCGAAYSYEEDAETCCEAARERERLFSRDYPAEIEQTEVTHNLYVASLDEVRPARLCSVEQEMVRGAAASALMLHRIGGSQYDSVMNYSHDGFPGEAFVKQDGSVPEGGGEVVYSRFNLAERREADRLSRAIACVRGLESADIVEIGEAAGLHIHISAVDIERQKVFGPAEMASLWEIFSFGEDVIYRIGAAGWAEHRGTEYTRILPKMNRPDLGGFTAGKISKEAQQHRYFSINFRRLLDAVQRCSCGACMVGDWNECECGTLDRGTVEWRVFNATTDPEILHSWILMAHGITAAAFDHQIGTLPPNEYNRTDRELHPWIFGWLLWNSPFQDSERQLLFNTARVSPGLYLPWDNIDAFHEGWGEIELPEITESAEPENFDEAGDREDAHPFDEDYRDECDCEECTSWREEAEQDSAVPQFAWQDIARRYEQRRQAQAVPFSTSDNTITYDAGSFNSTDTFTQNWQRIIEGQGSWTIQPPTITDES